MLTVQTAESVANSILERKVHCCQYWRAWIITLTNSGLTLVVVDAAGIKVADFIFV
jgi:hypothetical protein